TSHYYVQAAVGFQDNIMAWSDQMKDVQSEFYSRAWGLNVDGSYKTLQDIWPQFITWVADNYANDGSGMDSIVLEGDDSIHIPVSPRPE
ncbi:MAG: hypothetical protein ACOCX2_08635, partial [Armatimonadota bacterium]